MLMASYLGNDLVGERMLSPENDKARSRGAEIKFMGSWASDMEDT